MTKRYPKIPPTPLGLCNVAFGEGGIGQGRRRCAKPSGKYRTCSHHREKKRVLARKQRNRLRTEAYEHYGGACVCCGETNHLFLNLDHINSDGHLYRAETSAAQETYRIYREKPGDIQLLCYNCNLGRARNHGICPHLG